MGALLQILENGVMLCDGMGIWEKVWAPALLEGPSTASDLIAQIYGIFETCFKKTHYRWHSPYSEITSRHIL